MNNKAVSMLLPALAAAGVMLLALAPLMGGAAMAQDRGERAGVQAPQAAEPDRPAPRAVEPEARGGQELARPPGIEIDPPSPQACPDRGNKLELIV
jgi:hypothetical protein